MEFADRGLAVPTDSSAEPAELAGAEAARASGPSRISRRAAIGAGLAGAAGVGALMMFPAQLLAAVPVPADPVIILLKGKYKAAANPPNLSMHSVNLNDGSYSTTKIYPQRGVPGHTDETKAIGNFFVQFAGSLCAYNLPQGSMAMQFKKGQDFDKPIPDGSGGNWLVGNFDLTVLEGTGIYRSFPGGKNVMVDILHSLADKSFVEHCVCIISRP
jgi:hypothetical protein